MLVAAIPFGSAKAAGKLIAVRFGKLVDGSGRVQQSPLVVIEDDRVKSVLPQGAPVPAGVSVLDLSQYTAIPGLIDVHTHMSYLFDDQSGLKPIEQFLKRSSAVTVFLAQRNAQRTATTPSEGQTDAGAPPSSTPSTTTDDAGGAAAAPQGASTGTTDSSGQTAPASGAPQQ